MAGLRLVYSPSGSVSTSAKIDLGQPRQQFGRGEGVLIGRHLQLGVVQPVKVSDDSSCDRMRSCHIAITSCTG